MNVDFKKRQEQVFEIFEKLAVKARENKESFVFIGGSAVQSILEKPKRLSIDLDAYYSGNSALLLECLKPEFEISERKSRNEEQFKFFEAKKDNILVKIDLAKFPEHKSKFFQEKLLKNSKGKFKVKIAKPEYLLASKLSALAIGTIGRLKERKDFQTDFLKDIIDSNLLISLGKFTPKVMKFLEEITTTQNQLRNSNYSTEQVIESIEKAILESIRVKDDGIVTKGALQNFREYLLEKPILKPNYWEQAARITANLKVLKTARNGKKMEKLVKEYSNPTIANNWEAKLQEKGINKELLHELKTLSPKALGYYYFAIYPV